MALGGWSIDPHPHDDAAICAYAVGMTTGSSDLRDYQALAASMSSQGSRIQRMQQTADALWQHLHGTGVSWLGFYLPSGGSDGSLVLGPCRDKPACSPIGLHGVCGTAFLSRQVQIVRDVRDLGDAYIACDPRDRSEIVIPLLDAGGECWGVLDVDSWNVNAFDERDAAGLKQVLMAAGLHVVAAKSDRSASKQKRSWNSEV